MRKLTPEERAAKKAGLVVEVVTKVAAAEPKKKAKKFGLSPEADASIAVAEAEVVEVAPAVVEEVVAEVVAEEAPAAE
jgi:hypothetical protein